jgi:hypothetical protein
MTTLQTLRDEPPQALVTRVQGDLKALETLRIKKLETYSFRKTIGIPAAAILAPLCGYIDWMLLMWQSGSDDSAAGLTFVVLGALYAWVNAPKRQYTKAYKKNILPKIAHAFGLIYDKKRKIERQIRTKSKIFPQHDRYKPDDYFQGIYKGINVVFTEIKLEKKVRTNKRTSYQTVFNGLVIMLEINQKRFLGQTIMMQNKSKIGEWFAQKTIGLDKANLVDPEFEKSFDTFTNDQVEARYLIDPIIIERLKAVHAEYEGKDLKVSFFDQTVMIMIESKHNHFEPSCLYTPATDPESLKTMHREVVEILGFIDRLDTMIKARDDMPPQEKKNNKNKVIPNIFLGE